MTTTDLFHRTRVELTAGADAIGHAMRLAINNADRYVTLELECQPMVTIDGQRGWVDTRPLLDEREHSPELIDIWREVLAYADWRGLMERHPGQPHMARLAPRTLQQS